MTIAQFLFYNTRLAYFIIALIALLVGSLLNVIIYRLPIMLRQQWLHDCHCLLTIPETTADKKINLFFPRSFCPHCQSTIKFYQNIPLFSFLMQKRKCSSCKARIPWQYFFVELLMPLMTLYATWHFGFTIHLFFAMIFIGFVLVLFFIDLNHQILPDSLTLGLLWIGLLANTHSLFSNPTIAIYSAIAGYLFLWFILKVYYWLTGKIGMGNGDFKLFAAFGAWFGGAQLLLILLVAAFTGAIIGFIYLQRTSNDKNTPIPFGPFLCLAGLISLFWGQVLLQWYLSFWGL